MPRSMPRRRWPNSFASALLLCLGVSGCATVPNALECSAAGSLAAGALCAESVSGKTSEKTLQEYLDFLSPQTERPDPADPSKMLPKRAGAMCRSTDDFLRQKNAMETLCRLMGPRCTYEVKQVIKNMTELAARAKAAMP